MTNDIPSCRRRQRCALCGGRELARVLSLAPSPAGPAQIREPGIVAAVFPLDLGRCAACGHVQLLDIVDRITVLGRPTAADRASPRRVAVAESFARSLIERLRPPREALIVDIGSNDGTFLKVFEDWGLRVQGVEPAVNVAGEAIRAGVPTHPGLFSPAIADRIEETRGRAAIVVAHQAFAEAEDPFAVMEGVRLLLRRDGVFAFSVDSLAAIVEGDRLDCIDHRALAYHSAAPLKRFLTACDMELFAVARVGGRLNGLAQRLGGPHAADGSVDAVAGREAAAGLEDGSALPPFAARLSDLVATTAAALIRARDAGLRVAAFGAGCGVTTWMCQLGSEAAAAIAVLAADPPAVPGWFNAAFATPVVALDRLTSERPDLLLILDPDEEDFVRTRFAGLIDAGMAIVAPSAAGAVVGTP